MAALWTQITNVASWVCDPSRSDNAVNDETMQLQAVLDETRLRLHHEQHVSEELKAQVRDEQRRGEMRQREMREQLELQSEEISKLQAHLETATAGMHQKKEAFDQPQDRVAGDPEKKYTVTDASNARMWETRALSRTFVRCLHQLRCTSEDWRHCPNAPRSRRLPPPPW